MTSLVEQYGALGLFLVVALESIGLPLPGETAIIMASVAAGAGKLDIWLIVPAAIAGAILGDNIGYQIGRRYGRRVLERYGNRVGITHERYLKVESIAERYGAWMVVVARFFVLLRQLNGLTAGSTGMHWLLFFIANAIGAVLWVSLWSMLAYKLGHSVSILPWGWHHLSLVGGILTVALIIALVIFGHRISKRLRRSRL